MYNNPFFTFFVPGIFFNKSFTSSFAIFFGSATVFCFLTVPGFLAVAGFLTVPGFLAVPGFFVTPGVFGFNDGVFPRVVFFCLTTKFFKNPGIILPSNNIFFT